MVKVDNIQRFGSRGQPNPLARQTRACLVEHDHYEIMLLLQSARIPVEPVLDHGEVYDDPHVKERSFFE